MLKKILPHPYVTLLLLLVWMALNNSTSLGTVVFGAILAVAVSFATAIYWPDRPRIKSPAKAISFFFLVLWDIVVANFSVAKIVLFVPNAQLQPAWLAIPLALRQPEAIMLLAGTITMTPGTVSADMSADGKVLLVHCLHAPEPEATIAEIKSRYEARIQEIFA